MSGWWLWPYLFAALGLWAWSVIERGWRIRRAEKRHPLRALERITKGIER